MKTNPIQDNDSKMFRKVFVATTLALAAVTASVQAGQGPQPIICARSCWNARAGTTCTTMSALTRVIIHHTGFSSGSEWNSSGLSASAGIVRGIQNVDIDTHGFCDMEYHWLIDKYGNIFEGRKGGMNGQLIRGAHDAVNSNSHGVSLMGNFGPPFNHVAPTVMLNQLYALIAWRMPSAWSPYGSGTYGGRTVGFLDSHRKVNPSTACPGNNIQNLIGDNFNGGTVRNEVNARKSGAPPPPPPSQKRLDVFVRGTDNNLYSQWWQESPWSGWYGVGAGNMASDPTAVSWGPNRIDVFYRGTDNALWQKWFDGTGWYGPQSLGGSFVGSPDACSWGAGHVDVYMRGTDNGLWHIGFSGTWNPLTLVPGTVGKVVSDPGAVSWGVNRVDVFYREPNGSVGHNAIDGNVSWTWYYDNLGGVIVGGPDVCSWAPGHVDVYARSTDNALWHCGYSSGWSGWLQVPGTVGTMISDPSVVSYGLYRIDAFYQPAGGGLQHHYIDSSDWAWHNGGNLGGGIIGGPDAASWSGN